jgi:hypothetical protein
MNEENERLKKGVDFSLKNENNAPKKRTSRK